MGKGRLDDGWRCVESVMVGLSTGLKHNFVMVIRGELEMSDIGSDGALSVVFPESNL